MRAWTAHEAIQGIRVNNPELDLLLDQEGGRYQITSLKTGEPIREDQLLMPTDILIAPALDGQGNVGRAILGVGLIAGGAIFGGATVIYAGISLLGGAILNLLSGKNKKQNSDDEIKKSTIFEERGTAIDSDAVPEAYGRIKVTAQRLSEIISISDIATNG